MKRRAVVSMLSAFILLVHSIVPSAATQQASASAPTLYAGGTTPLFDVTQYGAVPNDDIDDTGAINQAILAAQSNGGGTVYIPAGVYRVDPSVGVAVKKGTTIVGDGDDASVLFALPGAGSVIRRDYNPQGPNQYVDNILIRQIAIVLNHERLSAENPHGSYAQIGFDFRHITRSTIEECYVGNYKRGTVDKIDGGDPGCNWREMIQGYGIVLGNTYSSSPAYCGGEVNTISRCTVWGVKKAIVLDDLTLSPLSAAHATVISNCDIQICESGIVQESRYTAGCVFNDNIVQAVGKAGYGDNNITSTNTTYFYRIEGYNNTINGGYIEDQARADYVIRLGSSSKRNKIYLGYYQTYNGLLEDSGLNNVLEYFDHVTGEYTKLVNRQPTGSTAQEPSPSQTSWVKFNGAGTILDGQGILSVTRNGTGDYTIVWDERFSSEDYPVSYMCRVDAGGSPGMVVIQEQEDGQLRLISYKSSPGKPDRMDFDYIVLSAADGGGQDQPAAPSLGTAFNKPFGLAVTADNSLIVCELEGNTVTVVEPDGKARSLGEVGTGNGQFSAPFGAAVGPDGSIYIADTQNHRIQKFSRTYRFQRSFGGSGSGDGQLNQPHFLTVNSKGIVLVSDTHNHRLSLFDSNGNWLRHITHPDFSYPTGIAVDAKDNIYVLNYGRSELMKFSDKGVYLATYGGPGDGNGQFAAPYGLFYRNNVLYVGDRNNNRVQKLDLNGNWMMTIGSAGTGEGQLREPSGVVVDSAGSVYVADWKNDRVQVFDSSGNFLRLLSKDS